MSEHPSAHTRGALQAALAAAPAVDLSGIDPPVRAEPWALRPDAVALLVALVRELRPTHILELGSGVSTRAFAWAAEEAAIQCTVTSVDHDAEFLEVSRHALRAPGDGVTVEFEHAPVVLWQVAGRFLPVYSLADRPRRPADLILIDGPPELLCGREGTLYQA